MSGYSKSESRKILQTLIEGAKPPYQLLAYGKLTDSDFRFRPAVDDRERELPVTQGSIDDLLGSPDREIRRTSWESDHDKYLEFRNTLAIEKAPAQTQRCCHW